MSVAVTVDDFVTLITEAPDYSRACDILRTVGRNTLNRIADQLYVEWEDVRRGELTRYIIVQARS
jgi:hypothetical protein